MARVALKIEKGECDNCLKTFPGWALYKPWKSEECYEAICGACIASKAAAKVKVAPLVLTPWETEAGKYLKAERNLALSFDHSGWAIMSDSPLTPACQASWLEYRAKLNRMTVDCSSPEEWVWPEKPSLEY